MNVKIDPGWYRALADQWDKPYFKDLTAFVRRRYGETTVYPRPSQIFAAFDSTPYDSVKVVILGQDPYHGAGQAHGLCFSVPENVVVPPSLVNIFKEMSTDLGVPYPAGHSGNLEYLAAQGVLLLNSTLTVEAGLAGSHQGKGWETLTDAAIRALADHKTGIVFMLWGAYAIRKGAFIDRSRHLVLESPHPSPLSAHRGFFGNHHFSRANDYLVANGKEPIKWL